MTQLDIRNRRLHNQHLTTPMDATPSQIVSSLVAVQSQDFMGAKWGIFQRTRTSTDADIEQAFEAGEILRTHCLRPTWHFVAPADIRWLLTLTAPRIHAANAYMYRKLELDADTLKRSHEVLRKVLAGGQQLTRVQIAAAIEQAGIRTEGELRTGYFLMHAELERLICSGGKQGKQFTYTLFDERVPPTQALTSDEALAELTRRYFTTRGPATLKDYAKWSLLTLTDARAGLEMVRPQFISADIDGQTYWFSDTTPLVPPSPQCYLLPNYDEYISGYADYSAINDPQLGVNWDATNRSLLSHYIVMDGVVVGTWKRTLKAREVIIETMLFRPLTDAESAAFNAAAQRYADYLGLQAKVL